MEEYKNDNMNPLSGGGEVPNVGQKQNAEYSAPLQQNENRGETSPANQQQGAAENIHTETSSWSHWPNPQPMEHVQKDQSQNPNTAGSETAFRPSYTQYTSLNTVQENKGTFNPAFVQKSESGEYRYRPPYANPGPNEKGSKHKRERKKKSGGTIALIVAAALLLSFGTGLGGAYFGMSLAGEESGSGNDPLVIYKTAVMADADGDEIKDPLTQAQVYDIVKNSVVEITTDFLTSYGNFQYVSSGAGSGVIISEDGYIATNNHVITSDNKVADTVKVRLTDGTEYEAEVVGRDEDSDVALLKIEAEDLTHAVFGDSSVLNVGDQVMAVGNPLGQLGGTATSGIVSATDREITVDNTVMTLIQIDAAINPGNSGGGLFNMKGELVGIVNAKSTGTEIEGLGFAIPINDASHVIEELKTNGYVTGKSFVGISLFDATDSYTAYRYFRSQATGVYIMKVVEGYNDTVLQVGDRVIAVDGTEITSASDVEDIISEHEVGDVLTFTVYRGGQMVEAQVTCYEYTPDTDITSWR